MNSAIDNVSEQYPAPYRQAILSAAKARKLDPRFILALIKQESVSNHWHPCGARGLLQLTMDAAQKYGPAAGWNSLRESQLYQPETSITVGGVSRTPGQTIPGNDGTRGASYNGGEDNVARWLARASEKTGRLHSGSRIRRDKGYVQKVMSNYRVYRRLYTADLMQTVNHR